MPMYAIRCECGSTDGFATIAAHKASNTASCTECDTECPTHIAPVSIIGLWADHGGLYVDQLERSFDSQSELNKFCEKNNLEVISASSSQSKDITWNAKQGAHDLAKREGYRDLDDRKHRRKKDKRDRVAAAREKTVKTYHKNHGGQAKSSAIETEFNTPLPSR